MGVSERDPLVLRLLHSSERRGSRPEPYGFRNFQDGLYGGRITGFDCVAVSPVPWWAAGRWQQQNPATQWREGAVLIRRQFAHDAELWLGALASATDSHHLG